MTYSIISSEPSRACKASIATTRCMPELACQSCDDIYSPELVQSQMFRLQSSLRFMPSDIAVHILHGLFIAAVTELRHKHAQPPRTAAASSCSLVPVAVPPFVLLHRAECPLSTTRALQYVRVIRQQLLSVPCAAHDTKVVSRRTCLLQTPVLSLPIDHQHVAVTALPEMRAALYSDARNASSQVAGSRRHAHKQRGGGGAPTET